MGATGDPVTAGIQAAVGIGEGVYSLIDGGKAKKEEAMLLRNRPKYNITPETYKESVYNFLRLYNKLIDIKLDNDKNNLLDFEYDIEKNKNLIMKQWLVEKAGELKKGAY